MAEVAIPNVTLILIAVATIVAKRLIDVLLNISLPL